MRLVPHGSSSTSRWGKGILDFQCIFLRGSPSVLAVLSTMLGCTRCASCGVIDLNLWFLLGWTATQTADIRFAFGLWIMWKHLGLVCILARLITTLCLLFNTRGRKSILIAKITIQLHKVDTVWTPYFTMPWFCLRPAEGAGDQTFKFYFSNPIFLLVKHK